MRVDPCLLTESHDDKRWLFTTCSGLQDIRCHGKQREGFHKMLQGLYCSQPSLEKWIFSQRFRPHAFLCHCMMVWGGLSYDTDPCFCLSPYMISLEGWASMGCVWADKMFLGCMLNVWEMRRMTAVLGILLLDPHAIASWYGRMCWCRCLQMPSRNGRRCGSRNAGEPIRIYALAWV